MSLGRIAVFCAALLGAEALSVSWSKSGSIPVRGGNKIKNLQLIVPQGIREGDEIAILECRYELDGVPLDSVKWYKDNELFYIYQTGQPITKESNSLPGVFVDLYASNSKQVVLNDIDYETTGSYSCQVTTKTQPPQTLSAAGAITTVNPSPRISNMVFSVKMTLPEQVQDGDKTAILQCEYSIPGETLYSVKWYKNDKEIYRFVPKGSPQKLAFPQPGANVNMELSDDKHLTLTGITKSTAGLYKCEVNTDAPLFVTMEAKSNLNVLDAVASRAPAPPPPAQPQKPQRGNIFHQAHNWVHEKFHSIIPK